MSTDDHAAHIYAELQRVSGQLDQIIALLLLAAHNDGKE